VAVFPDLSALARRLPARCRTRFAPAPTGYLHLGHVVNAIYVWGLARALGGRVLLRIENHDGDRSRPEYETALLDDLDWLGFAPDEGATATFRRGSSPYRQRDHDDVYRVALERLHDAARVYACACTRRDIAAATGAREGHEPRYPGTCRDRRLAPGPGLGLRVELAAGTEVFDDALCGVQRQDPSMQCGDLLLRDRLGYWTYQFAATVDDLRQSVDLVIRGADLLDSTGRQIRLARLLGRERPPVYMHHGLLVKPSGEKLSKSNGDTGVRDLRARGLDASEVIGRAAHLAGLQDDPRPLPADSVAACFDA
jgi:glutamyl-Q tRNA(Asp) synthetase